MAANSKRTSGGASTTYLRASQHRDDLLEEARSLRRAGKIRAAKGVEGRVQQVEQLVGVLDGESPGRTSASD
jgi:hypothetical protein